MSTTSKLTTAEQIEDFISKHPGEELITRRQLIPFGSAAVVDNIIFKLVHKTGSLVRIAWGCYRKRERVTEVTGAEVARVKAAAFGRSIVPSPRTAAFNLGISDRPAAPLEFLTSGRSSSFQFQNQKIFLTGASPRKMSLGEGKIGQAIRALWHLGKSIVDEHVIGKATRSFSTDERIEMGKLCASMPEWLGQFFYPWRLLERVSRPQFQYPDDLEQLWLHEASALYCFSSDPNGSRLALTG